MTDDPAPLTPLEAARLLGATVPILNAELRSLPEAVLRWRPAPGEWCILEALGHLIEAEERGFAGRIRQFLAEDDPVCITWDPPAVARGRRDCEGDPAALLADFVARREASVALVAGLDETDLDRGGRHPEVGRLRVGELLHEWVHHDGNHLRQILANVQAYVWPAMGNSQRFSQP